MVCGFIKDIVYSLKLLDCDIMHPLALMDALSSSVDRPAFRTKSLSLSKAPLQVSILCLSKDTFVAFPSSFRLPILLPIRLLLLLHRNPITSLPPIQRTSPKHQCSTQTHHPTQTMSKQHRTRHKTD